MRIIKFTSTAIGIVLCLNGCSWFAEETDPITAGSLTLTPLQVPDGLSNPKASGDMVIPSFPEQTQISTEVVTEQPPAFDESLAKAEALKFRSNTSQSGLKEILSMPSTINQQPGGYSVLLVESGFDQLWEYMGDVAKGLGFKVEDRNRNKKIYDISRQLAKSPIQEEEEKETGVERRTGTKERYQVHLEEKQKKSTELSIRNPEGKPDDSKLAQHLLVQIKAYLEQPLKK